MPTSVRLDHETERRLDFLSAETGRSKAFYIRAIINKGITDAEDYYLASNILNRVRLGDENTHSLADVRKDLELDD